MCVGGGGGGAAKNRLSIAARILVCMAYICIIFLLQLGVKVVIPIASSRQLDAARE